jgi:alpha-D-ribose 1-methylphosphonate 5-triphosphate synthase subunit PhnG
MQESMKENREGLMNKVTLSRIAAFAGPEQLSFLAEKASSGKSVVFLKKPEKTMILLQVREPLEGTLFYLGEALASHCIVEVEGVRGAAVQLGDDLGKVTAAAIIDAVHSAEKAGGFTGFTIIKDELLRLDEKYRQESVRQAALVRSTQVIFHSLEDQDL